MKLGKHGQQTPLPRNEFLTVTPITREYQPRGLLFQKRRKEDGGGGGGEEPRREGGNKRKESQNLSDSSLGFHIIADFSDLH